MSLPLNQNSIASTTPIDFTFCEIPKTNQNINKNENPFGFSPPRWPKTVLSDHYIYKSYPSSVMAEGRKELMELMPESCYELSLKDIVVKKDSDNSSSVTELEKSDHTKHQIKGKKKGTNKGSISRSVSLDTGVYILKMFVPSSLGSKKQRVPRSKSTSGSMKHSVDIEKRLSFGNDVSSRLSNNRSSCTTTRKNRYGEGMLEPNGCLFTSKPTNQKGCIFF